MTESHESLATRKALLLAQSRMQRMELALSFSDVREALRPARMIGGAFAKPAAAVAAFQMIAPLFGLRRVARWVRIAAVAFAVFRVVRTRRATDS
jgi:hypothetical protein